MRRLRPLDWLLLGTLLPAWAVCLVLHVEMGPSLKFPPIELTIRSLDGAQNLRVGDLDAGEVIRIEDHGLRGASPATVYAIGLEKAESTGRVSVTFLAANGERTLILESPPDPWWWRLLPYGIGIVGVGVICLLRLPDRKFGRSFFVMSMSHAIVCSPFWGGSAMQTYAAFGVWTVVLPIAAALSLRGASRFPSGHGSSESWEEALPWCFGVGFAVVIGGHLWIPSIIGLDWMERLLSPLALAYLAVTLLLLTRNFRRTDAGGRRRIKWALLGFYLGLMPITLAASGSELGLMSGWRSGALAAGYVSLVAIPIGLLIAFVGYRYLDIDPLISSTASYSILGVTVISGVLVLIPEFAEAAGALAGVEASSAQILLSIGLAGLAIPAHRHLRPRIERVFFPERTAPFSDASFATGPLATAVPLSLPASFDPASTYARSGATATSSKASVPSTAPASDASPSPCTRPPLANTKSKSKPTGSSAAVPRARADSSRSSQVTAGDTLRSSRTRLASSTSRLATASSSPAARPPTGGEASAAEPAAVVPAPPEEIAKPASVRINLPVTPRNESESTTRVRASNGSSENPSDSRSLASRGGDSSVSPATRIPSTTTMGGNRSKPNAR